MFHAQRCNVKFRLPGIDTGSNGNTVYTGDAPSCLVDQKKDACHWDSILLRVLTEHADTLTELFNG